MSLSELVESRFDEVYESRDNVFENLYDLGESVTINESTGDDLECTREDLICSFVYGFIDTDREPLTIYEKFKEGVEEKNQEDITSAMNDFKVGFANLFQKEIKERELDWPPQALNFLKNIESFDKPETMLTLLKIAKLGCKARKRYFPEQEDISFIWSSIQQYLPRNDDTPFDYIELAFTNASVDDILAFSKEGRSVLKNVEGPVYTIPQVEDSRILHIAFDNWDIEERILPNFFKTASVDYAKQSIKESYYDENIENHRLWENIEKGAGAIDYFSQNCYDDANEVSSYLVRLNSIADNFFQQKQDEMLSKTKKEFTENHGQLTYGQWENWIDNLEVDDQDIFKDITEKANKIVEQLNGIAKEIDGLHAHLQKVDLSDVSLSREGIGKLIKFYSKLKLIRLFLTKSKNIINNLTRRYAKLFGKISDGTDLNYLEVDFQNLNMEPRKCPSERMPTIISFTNSVNAEDLLDDRLEIAYSVANGFGSKTQSFI